MKPPQLESTQPKVVKKSFKLTYKQEGSGTRSVVVDITPELSFGRLVQLAETEFGISESKQKFKMGFPPKILKMEPTEPLMVSSIKNIMHFIPILFVQKVNVLIYSRTFLHRNRVSIYESAMFVLNLSINLLYSNLHCITE